MMGDFRFSFSVRPLHVLLSWPQYSCVGHFLAPTYGLGLYVAIVRQVVT